MNPPYGERLHPEDMEDLYQEIGDAFKQHYAGYNCWVITSNMDALKAVGLKTSRRIPLYNGKLECRFVKYEMYQGTRKVVDEEDKQEPWKAVIDYTNIFNMSLRCSFDSGGYVSYY